MTPRVLVAGVGNIFLGDDAFGVEVIARLHGRAMPEGVEVVDFGIRGIDLAFALEKADAVILVDAAARGGAPGTLYVIEPDLDGDEPLAASPHAMTLDRVLRGMPRDARPRWLRLVGCEPASFGDEDAPGLSPEVDAAVGEAADMISALVREYAEGEARHA